MATTIRYDSGTEFDQPLDSRFLGDSVRELPTGGASRLLWFAYPQEWDALVGGRLELDELRERADERERRARAQWEERQEGHQ